MAVTAPETVARAALKALIVAEFSTEGYPVEDDKLHESLGSDKTVIGTSPVRTRPNPRNQLVLLSEILVQFYGKWDKEIDPTQIVDPAAIETDAERFRRALRPSNPQTDDVWYFQLVELTYPDDPTGNKTRFEASVVAVGNNPALIETTG